MKTIFMLAAFAIVIAIFGYLIVPRVPQQDATSGAPATAWNPAAVHSTLAGIQVREVDPNHAAIVFLYDLDNQTDADYQLAKGSNAIIMTRLKSDGTLVANDALQLDNSVFLPARNRTRISFQETRAFHWPTELAPGHMGPLTLDKYRSFVAQEVANLSGFVLFDQAAHYQIELPGGWQDVQPAAVTGATGD
jgi:hypothetical protein